jgi:hypothetical protein
MTDQFSLTPVLFNTAALLAAALFGLVALFAATSQRNLLWGTMLLALLLATLAPIGAYELLALYATQAAVVLATIFIASFVRNRRSGIPIRITRPRFGLRDALIAIIPASVVFAIVRNAAPSTGSPLGWPIEWWKWIAAGAGLAAVTLAAAWAAWSAARWYLRLVVLIVVAPAAAGAAILAWSAVGAEFGQFEYISRVSQNDLVAYWPALAAGLFGLETLIWLFLVGFARWITPRLVVTVDRARDKDSARADQPPRTQGASRLLGRSAIGAASLSGIAYLTIVYWWLLPPAMPVSELLPRPIGHEELMRAAAALNWTPIQGDFEEASPQACQSFVQANLQPLALVRHGLTQPCQREVSYSMSRTMEYLPDIEALRSLCRALCPEGKATAATGQHQLAMHSYLDTIRLAVKISRGGLMLDDLVGDSIESSGLNGLVAEVSQLDASGLDALRRSLEEIEDAREPVELCLAREQVWNQLASGWIGRLHSFAEYLRYGELQWNESVASSRARVIAHLHLLLLAEAAVRRHVIVEGKPPETLASLVPEYLAAVPQDPFGPGPLVYRRKDDGYLLYSVGQNGIDDGGQRVAYIEAISAGGYGDFFFDASTDAPNEDPTVEADASAESPIP